MPPLQHARLGASNAHRWMNCLGSVRMSAGLPEIEEDYQLEGRAAHTFAEQWLKGEQLLDHVWIDTEGGKKTYPVDDEMRESTKLFVDAVREAYTKLPWSPEDTGPAGVLLIEQRVDLGLLRPPEPMFGTADVILLGERVLRVFDLKYGRGVVVEVRKNGTLNEQLMYYVLGAVLKAAMKRLLDPADSFQIEEGESFLHRAVDLFDEITVTIVQPRAGHIDGPVRSTEVTRQEIVDFAGLLMDRAERAQDPAAPLTPGDWCRFCPAQGSCPALKQHAQALAQVEFDAVPLDMPPSPEHLSVAVVADMLTQVPILESWIAAMYKRVTSELEAGRPVPGWKLVNKRAVRRWADEAEAMKWMELSGIPAKDAFEPVALKSPAGIEKVIGRNIPEVLITKESSGTNLVPESDPRPAAAVGAAEVFPMLPPPSPAKEAESLNG